VIGAGSKIAPGASVINKVKIGRGVQVGIGAVVTRGVDDYSTVVGNPAKKIR
jgi:acetyltransferase-like isoleucine patch superfamily enzyme